MERGEGRLWGIRKDGPLASIRLGGHENAGFEEERLLTLAEVVSLIEAESMEAYAGLQLDLIMDEST